MKLSRKEMHPRMFYLVCNYRDNYNVLMQYLVGKPASGVIYFQFTDILLYTTPVANNQFRLNLLLPLEEIKVNRTALTTFIFRFYKKQYEAFFFRSNCLSRLNSTMNLVSSAQKNRSVSLQGQLPSEKGFLKYHEFFFFDNIEFLALLRKETSGSRFVGIS